MKKRIPLIAAASVLATTGVVGLVGSSASAGCGATVEVHNLRSSAITVDWEDSDSRSGANTPFGVVAGPWKMLLNNTENYILPGDTESRAIVLDFPCSTLHQFRLEIEQGGSSWFVQTGWLNGSLAHIHVT